MKSSRVSSAAETAPTRPCPARSGARCGSPETVSQVAWSASNWAVNEHGLRVGLELAEGEGVLGEQVVHGGVEVEDGDGHPWTIKSGAAPATTESCTDPPADGAGRRWRGARRRFAAPLLDGGGGAARSGGEGWTAGSRREGIAAAGGPLDGRGRRGSGISDGGKAAGTVGDRFRTAEVGRRRLPGRPRRRGSSGGGCAGGLHRGGDRRRWGAREPGLGGDSAAGDGSGGDPVAGRWETSGSRGRGLRVGRAGRLRRGRRGGRRGCRAGPNRW